MTASIRTLALSAGVLSSSQALAGPPELGPYGAISTSSILGNIRYNAPNDRMVGSGGAGYYEASSSILGVGQSDVYHNRGGGESYASLSKGTVGAKAFAEALGPDGTVMPSAGGIGFAKIWDTVTIQAGSGDAFARIPMQLELDGFSTGPTDATNAYATARVYVFDIEADQMLYEKTIRSNFGTVFLNTDLDLGGIPALTTRRYMVGYSIYAYANVGASLMQPGSALADYSHTLHFRWDMPSNLSFTSESGLFNPGATQPVPEPASMTALGAGALGLLKRRRSRKA